MKKLTFFKIALSTVILAGFTFLSCQKEQVKNVADTPVSDETQYYNPNLSDFVTSRSGSWTTIPAGSVDALNQAIAEADAGGVIYLKAGLHTETNRVTVDKTVKIIGEDGAVLRITSTDAVSTTNPAIHVVNAPGTAIQNVEIQPFGDGAYTAVLLDNSPQSAVLSSKIFGFPLGILVEKSDRTALINNTIEGTGTDNGILVNRGKSAYIANNDISGFDIGIWACDKWGTAENNHLHLSNAGFLLCKYNALFGVTIPNSGDPIGAEFSATGWKLRNNKFTDNYYAGLSVRDGSNHNLVQNNNQYSGNGTYDISIPADEDIPGFLFIPAAFKNVIQADSDVLIQNCGIDNVIVGGTMSTDPC